MFGIHSSSGKELISAVTLQPLYTSLRKSIVVGIGNKCLAVFIRSRVINTSFFPFSILDFVLLCVDI